MNYSEYLQEHASVLKLMLAEMERKQRVNILFIVRRYCFEHTGVTIQFIPQFSYIQYV